MAHLRAPCAAFLAGYLLVWLAFSIVATVVQYWLERSGVSHSMMMWSVNTVWSGSLLIATGLYQLSPVKNVCLKHCRSPGFFLAENWRGGARGALRLGVVHGLFCVGCWWFLVALLFVGGVMNVVWIAGLTLMVAMEKLLPRGEWVGRCGGLIMICAAIHLLFFTPR
jgi:predicted metal-binding membrane protein